MQGRLNSPRSKFETTWRANKKDIPGTSAEQIKKLTVGQLKFWIKRRRINKNRPSLKQVKNSHS